MTALRLQNLLADAFQEAGMAAEQNPMSRTAGPAPSVPDDLLEAAREAGRQEVRQDVESRLHDLGSVIRKLEDTASAFAAAKTEATRDCVALLEAILSTGFRNSLSAFHRNEALAFIERNIPHEQDNKMLLKTGTELAKAFEDHLSGSKNIQLIPDPDYAPYQVEIEYENSGAVFDPERILTEILETVQGLILTGDEET